MVKQRASIPLVLGVCGLLAAAPLLATWPPPMPPSSDLVLTVRETGGITRTNEVLTSGLPLPRSLGLVSTTSLAIVDASATPVAAEFRVLARWHAGLAETSAPIQWLLVSFPANVAANGTSTYRLVVDGSVANPAPSSPLSLTQIGNQVTVATGAATFVLGGDPHTLFQEIRSANGTLQAAGGALELQASGLFTHNGLRAVEVIHAGPLTAIVQVRGTYGAPSVGGGALASVRRYVFRAGSPTALVRHALSWEGSLCGLGEISCGSGLNAVTIQGMRDRLVLQTAAPWTTQLVADRDLPSLSGTVAAGQLAEIRQTQRANRSTSPVYQTDLPGPSTSSGEFADGGMLAASNAAGGVGIALRSMHLYEPQALSQFGNTLSVLPVGAPVPLGSRQGLFANFAVGTWDASPTRSQLDQNLWAPLNRPLRAWPSPAWWAASQAVEEFPHGTLAGDLASYDTKIPAILGRTQDLVLERGLQGLMTHGVWPRYWGDPLLADEIDCGTDPTPATDSDDVYWCTTWADYHNAGATAAIWAFRSGEVAWLDELAAPAAWRVLHTVIQQCAPGDPFFYCGQAPTGYGGYRSDNNGSHAYFDNLLLHYWLTGDETIVQTLEVGARSMRGFLCPGRGSEPPGAMCSPDTPLVDPWAGLNGRGATQWYRVFRFLGLASDDASYLDDWQGNTARWLTQYWAQPGAGAASRGFTVPSGGGSLDAIDGPGTYTTDQLWMASLYDFDALERLTVDRQNAPLGNPPLAPAEAQVAWARSLAQIGSATPLSTGTAAGPWPNVVGFSFTGPRVGGTLTQLAASHIDADGDGTPCELCDDDGDNDNSTCADVCLYEEGKSPLGAVFARSADHAGDLVLADLALDFASFGLAALGENPQPLNKKMGIGLSRLHAAVARASQQMAETPLFADGFEGGSTLNWSNTVP